MLGTESRSQPNPPLPARAPRPTPSEATGAYPEETQPDLPPVQDSEGRKAGEPPNWGLASEGSWLCPERFLPRCFWAAASSPTEAQEQPQ